MTSGPRPHKLERWELGDGLVYYACKARCCGQSWPPEETEPAQLALDSKEERWV